MDIEKLATAALKKSISQTDFLADFVNDGDKEPSWDGNIYIYADSTKSKKGIKKIPVQVKGEGRKKIPPQKAPKFRVSIIDLDNWLRDGGVMLFVVLIDDTGDNSAIFYRGLTPVMIRNLKKWNPGKKMVRVPLRAFPKDNNEKVVALLNFFENMKKQTSFATAPLLTTEELSKEGMLESITFSATTFGKRDEQDPISAFLSDDVYMYANVKGSSIPQPLEEMPLDLHIGRDIDGAVCSGGQQYYSRYRLVRYSEGMDAVIGKSITLKISADKTAGKLNFKLAGTLNDYIRDTECMIAIVENRELSLNGAAFAFSDVGKANIEQYRQNLAYYQDVKKMLDALGVTKELEPGNLSEQDEKNIRNFTNAIVHGHLIGFPGCSDDLVYGRFKIANLEICIWANKEDGGYRLHNFFSDHTMVLFAGEDKENQNSYPVSHYVLLKKKDLLEIDNIDYEKIAAEIAENSTYPMVTNQLTLFMLEMLKAYDEQEQKDKRLLELAEEYCLWLNALPEGYTDESKLNQLQINKRKRDLTSEELSLLNELRKSGHEIEVRCGANLLLGKNESAQDCFDEMPEDTKRQFIEYPICNFGKIQYERPEE